MTRRLTAISERTLLYQLDPSGNWCRHLHALPGRVLIAGCGMFFSPKDFKTKQQLLRWDSWRAGSRITQGTRWRTRLIKIAFRKGVQSILHLNVLLHTLEYKNKEQRTSKDNSIIYFGNKHHLRQFLSKSCYQTVLPNALHCSVTHCHAV